MVFILVDEPSTGDLASCRSTTRPTLTRLMKHGLGASRRPAPDGCRSMAGVVDVVHRLAVPEGALRGTRCPGRVGARGGTYTRRISDFSSMISCRCALPFVRANSGNGDVTSTRKSCGPTVRTYRFVPQRATVASCTSRTTWGVVSFQNTATAPVGRSIGTATDPCPSGRDVSSASQSFSGWLGRIRHVRDSRGAHMRITAINAIRHARPTRRSCRSSIAGATQC
jgi:hypothetical protein